MPGSDPLRDRVSFHATKPDGDAVLGKHRRRPVSARLRIDGAVLELTDDALNALARRVAELVDGNGRPDPWLDVAGAAEYLSCTTSRIYSLVGAHRIPVHRDGSRLL